jgi:hypothetical protein
MHASFKPSWLHNIVLTQHIHSGFAPIVRFVRRGQRVELIAKFLVFG